MVTRDLHSRFEALREAVGLVPADPPSKERAQVLTSFADALVLAGRNDEAHAASQEAVAIARQLGAESELSRALTILGWAQATPGPSEPDVVSRREAGLASLREACQLAVEQADPELVAHAYGWLGEVLMEIGRLGDAVQESLSGRDRVRRLGLTGSWPSTFLLANAVEALYKLGRWDEANELANQALANARPQLFSETSLPPLLAAAMVEVGRGEFQAAEAHLAAIKDRSLAGVADLAREYTALLAELRLWQGRLEEARAAVQDGLDRVAGTDEQMRSGRLLCLGLRIEADQAELGRAHHNQREVHTAVQTADALASRAAAMAPNPLVPGATTILTTPAVKALWQAERTRLDDQSDSAQRQQAATAWLVLGRPYPAAYAQWRQAEALLATKAPKAQAEETLRAAHAVAVRLRAEPLRHELELLAQRGRVRLEVATEPSPATAEAPSVPASLGLTAREAEVLALVAAGRTNRQIGQELFIAPKTAASTSQGSWPS